MNCQQIQDQLLTDYMDGELPVDKKNMVDGHLAVCDDCRELFAHAAMLNDGIMHQPLAEGPSERVWMNIRDKVSDAPLSWGERLAGWWEGFTFNLRPSMAYGSVFAAVLVILMVIVPVQVKREQSLASADKEALLQLVYADEDVSAPGVEDAGRGNPVDYLL